MSVYFIHQGSDLWNPGHRTAHLLLRQVRLLEELFESPSGVGQPVSDEVQIDLGTLRTFVARAQAVLRDKPNPPLFALASGPLGIVMALLRRQDPDARQGGADKQLGGASASWCTARDAALDAEVMVELGAVFAPG